VKVSVLFVKRDEAEHLIVEIEAKLFCSISGILQCPIFDPVRKSILG